MSGITPSLSQLSIIFQAAANVTTSHLLQSSLGVFTWLSYNAHKSELRNNLDRVIRVTAYTALPISLLAIARDRDNTQGKLIAALVSLAAWGALKIRDQGEEIESQKKAAKAKAEESAEEFKKIKDDLEEQLKNTRPLPSPVSASPLSSPPSSPPSSPLRVRSLPTSSEFDSLGIPENSSSPYATIIIKDTEEPETPAKSTTPKNQRPAIVPRLALMNLAELDKPEGGAKPVKKVEIIEPKKNEIEPVGNFQKQLLSTMPRTPRLEELKLSKELTSEEKKIAVEVSDKIQKIMDESFIKLGEEKYRLNFELGMLEKKVALLETELREEKAHINELNVEMESKREEFENEKALWKQLKNSFEKDLKEMEDCRAKTLKASERCTELTKEMVSMTTDLGIYKKLKVKQDAIIDDAKIKNQQLREKHKIKLEQLRKEKEADLKLIQELREKEKEWGGITPRSTKEQIHNQTETTVLLEKALNTHRERNKKMQEDLNILQEEGLRLKNQKEALNEQMKNLADSFTQKLADLTERYSKKLVNSMLDESLSTSSKELLEKEITNLNVIKELHASQLDRLDKQIETLEKEKQDQADMLKQVLAERNDLHEKWEGYIEQSLANELHGTQIKANLEKLEEEKDVLLQNFTTTKAMLISRTEQNEELENKLKKLNSKMEVLKIAEDENRKMKVLLNQYEQDKLLAEKAKPLWPYLERLATKIKETLGESASEVDIVKGIENNLKKHHENARDYQKKWSNVEALNERLAEIFQKNPSNDKAKGVMTLKRHSDLVERHTDLVEQQGYLLGRVERFQKMYENAEEIAKDAESVAYGACKERDELCKELEEQEDELAEKEEEKKELEDKLLLISQELEKAKEEKEALKELYKLEIGSLEAQLKELESIDQKKNSEVSSGVSEVSPSEPEDSLDTSSIVKKVPSLNFSGLFDPPGNASPLPERLSARLQRSSIRSAGISSSEFEEILSD